MSLPHIINTYCLPAIKNYCEAPPDAIFKSAQINGTSHRTILSRFQAAI